MSSKEDIEKVANVEHNEVAGSDDGVKDASKVMGTTKLTEDELLLVPAPSADPRGMPRSRRLLSAIIH